MISGIKTIARGFLKIVLEFYKLSMKVASFFFFGPFTPKWQLIRVYMDAACPGGWTEHRRRRLAWRCLTLINDASIASLSSCYFIFIFCHGLALSGENFYWTCFAGCLTFALDPKVWSSRSVRHTKLGKHAFFYAHKNIQRTYLECQVSHCLISPLIVWWPSYKRCIHITTCSKVL